MSLTCFKAYDIRGRLGENLDVDVASRIGQGFAQALRPGRVVVGHDARETSPALKAAVSAGLMAEGVEVIDIGLCGTEEVYFATGETGAGGGIMVTASHNPIDYNGMKLVGPGSRPIDPDTELSEVKRLSEAAVALPGPHPQQPVRDLRAAYATHCAAMIDANQLRPLKLVVNAGNGTAGAAFDAIFERLNGSDQGLEVIRLHHQPDARFPNGIPNPLLPENRAQTADLVIAEGADLGLAWDGDFDRCFFFDAAGGFVDGEYVVALLARAFLQSEPGATIVHDPRVIWATTEGVRAAGGQAVASRTGHAFLKSKMRACGAVYGGEMSAHHYFRDFYYCDSGMIPWLKVVELMGRTGSSLSDLVTEMRSAFPSSGEINFRVAEPNATVEAVLAALQSEGPEVDRLDGASLDFGEWRMNLRASNTEPLLRLNVEARGNSTLLAEKVEMVRGLIARHGAD